MAAGTIALVSFIRDMLVLQARLPPLLVEEDNRQAGRIAREARSRGAGLGGVHRHTAPGIKAVNQRPIIRLFGDEQPAIFGAEFGGGARPTTRQFPPWRGKGADAGYMLFPTIRAQTEERFEQDYADVVQKIAGFSAL